MKRSPADIEREKLFSASKFSAEGFMGTDTRSVEEIIAEDDATLEKNGVSRAQTASFLREVFDKAEAALGDPVTIADGITAVHYEARGKVPSPFRGDGVFQKGEVVITISSPATTLIITRLGINLIAAHGFFQGRGSRYRIEPEDLVPLVKGS